MVKDQGCVSVSVSENNGLKLILFLILDQICEFSLILSWNVETTQTWISFFLFVILTNFTSCSIYHDYLTALLHNSKTVQHPIECAVGLQMFLFFNAVIINIKNIFRFCGAAVWAETVAMFMFDLLYFKLVSLNTTETDGRTDRQTRPREAKWCSVRWVH